MGARLSDAGYRAPPDDGAWAPRWRLLLALLTCLALAACADSDKRSGNNPFGGWYGGVVGGAAQ